MSYDPTKPGMEESRQIAYRAFFVSKLHNLNTMLARPGFNSNTGMAPITAEMVELGDSETAWDLADGPIRMRITNGDQVNGDDFTASLFQSITFVSGNTGWEYDFCTHVYVYLHPDLFGGTNAPQQIADRELCLNRIADWFIGECNFWDPVSLTGGTVVPLESSIIGVPNDKLIESMVAKASRSITLKSMGATEYYPSLYVRIDGKIM